MSCWGTDGEKEYRIDKGIEKEKGIRERTKDAKHVIIRTEEEKHEKKNVKR